MLTEFADLRQQGLASGVDALQVIGTSMLMPKQEHNQLLKNVIGDCKSASASTAVRIFVEGSSIDNLQLYQMIESLGTIVVAEDSDWGIRSFEGQIAESGNPIEAIYTMIAKCTIEGGDITQVSYIPAIVNKQAQPKIVTQNNRGQEVFDYVKTITEGANLNANFAWRGDEVIIEQTT